MLFTFPIGWYFPVGVVVPVGCVLLFYGCSFCYHIGFIVHFLFFRFFAGYFCVFACNSLIINAIHFSGVQAFSDRGLSEPLIHLIDLIFRMWVVWMRVYLVISVHIGFIVHFFFCRLFAGLFCVFWCNSLIINDIHFCRLYAFAGSFGGEELHTGSVGCCGNDCGDALGNCILT